ncbi:MAG: anhydro-N-acetylmuramic acid kinase [Hyphomicrobiaceae bacterium]
MTKLYRAIGLMSGTSMDGIDAAMLITDGEAIVERGAVRHRPYPDEVRERLRQGLADAREIAVRTARPGGLDMLERELTGLNARLVSDLLVEAGIARGEVDLIGYHGQTVLHRPADRLTVQLGDGALLARLTGIDVVYDLRAADMAAGGQGAPLVPVYHRALAATNGERPIAFLNLGGVANITWVGRDGRLIAFDTGPGSALIDDWVQRLTGEPFDRDGRLALSGTVDGRALAALLADPFFAALPPKSLDRNAFSGAPLAGLSPADGAATLAAFTADAVHRALAHLPEPPRIWVVCGGGRRNRAIMMALAGRLEAAVVPSEAIGLDGAWIEAEAWAYLAVRALKELPITFPMTTGVPAAMTGGVIARRP